MFKSHRLWLFDEIYKKKILHVKMKNGIGFGEDMTSIACVHTIGAMIQLTCFVLAAALFQMHLAIILTPVFIRCCHQCESHQVNAVLTHAAGYRDSCYHFIRQNILHTKTDYLISFCCFYFLSFVFCFYFGLCSFSSFVHQLWYGAKK